MSRVIGGHHTCSVRGRSIHTNVHVARSVLHSCTDSGGRLALAQADLAKAFERVNHEILFALLEHAYVGRTILDGVRLCYHICTTRLKVNGHLSGPICTESSAKQGCLMSPLLFAFYLETLGLRVRSSPIVWGYRLYSEEVKVLAYADDAAFFCVNKRDVDNALDITQVFCDATGAQLNSNKRSGLCFCNWATTSAR